MDVLLITNYSHTCILKPFQQCFASKNNANAGKRQSKVAARNLLSATPDWINLIGSRRRLLIWTQIHSCVSSITHMCIVWNLFLFFVSVISSRLGPPSVSHWVHCYSLLFAFKASVKRTISYNTQARTHEQARTCSRNIHASARFEKGWEFSITNQPYKFCLPSGQPSRLMRFHPRAPIIVFCEGATLALSVVDTIRFGHLSSWLFGLSSIAAWQVSFLWARNALNCYSSFGRNSIWFGPRSL